MPIATPERLDQALNAEKVERRYREASEALSAWRTAAHAAVEAEYDCRAAAVLHDRARDFQAHGLGPDGRP